MAANTDDCIEWPYGRCRGYGKIVIDNKHMGAHRYVCIQAHGEPNGRMDAAHNCGNRLCVNPRHLRWDTRKGNEADKLAHGRHVRGERNGQSKLSEDAVKEIMSLRGIESGVSLARRFGVSPNTICAIYKGRRWNWLSAA